MLSRIASIDNLYMSRSRCDMSMNCEEGIYPYHPLQVDMSIHACYE